MDKIALLFPGQGSQTVGMGKNISETFPEAREIFKEADQLLTNPSLSNLCFFGPDELLRLTVNAQPAIFTVSMAAYRVFQRLNQPVAYAAGHSVGEYGALCAAGVFSFEDGLKLVRKRGELMFESGRNRPGSMSAILGLNSASVEEICKKASGEKIVEVANLNSPSQVVISGDPEAVQQAGEIAKFAGAKRVVPLPVSGAFHSALMEDAALRLGRELDKVYMKDAVFPVVANVTAKPVIRGPEARVLLKKQIRAKVSWEETVRFMIGDGVNVFIEMEPGNVLTGLVRSIDKTVKTVTFPQLLASALTP